ncbi:UTP--glucose-1-phosphate uridylyltransferase [Chloroflexi bacterium TSY]|nr:UTP--glucose-1-phosphate uridylyltransferase [Chloroflexi bacterium TSY]
MRAEKLPELVIETFHHYYSQLVHGETGFISNAEAEPIDTLQDAESLAEEYKQIGCAALHKTVLLKLNGGLGTSMGMAGPKSLLPVKDGRTFLDIIIQQVLYLRNQHQSHLPLVLMNSFNTDEATTKALTDYPELKQDIPFSFIQHKIPKIDVETLMPAQCLEDPEKEWCPPGHGDIYAALITSGLLQRLRASGYEYVFVSNADNLGASLDLSILGYFANKQCSFLMEVADRTMADSKGGHLACRPDGSLLLREVAQCPPEELESFQDIDRYKFFNTNNLWIHLPTLERIAQEQKGILDLPLIRNEKPVDPTNPSSPRVYQLETAMGSAIGVIPGAEAIRVPRMRFAPVKKNQDLLILMSDAFRLKNDFSIEQAITSLPTVELDSRYYNLIQDLKMRFPYGAPSLRRCQELRIQGDVRFGADVSLVGKVDLVNATECPLTVADGTVVRGN